MRYISLDIETAGLSEECDIIEIGAVLEDTDNMDIAVGDLPSIRILIRHPRLVAEPYALGMHVDSGLLKKLQRTPDPEDLPKNTIYCASYHSAFQALATWLQDNQVNLSKVRMAGKNIASFDWPRLEAKGIKDYLDADFRFLDIGPMFIPEYKKEYGISALGWIPSLSSCLQLAGVRKSVAHNAVEDAEDVIQCVRYILNKVD